MKNILTIYEQYREKKPVMLFDMQEQRIYVYPYLDRIGKCIFEPP